MENILFVDDEENILEGLRRQFRKQFHVHTALGGPQGLKMVMEHGPFAVIVTDERMPGMDGIQFLAKIREVTPESVRIMLTGNNDLDTAIGAVNQGAIFRFLTKPCSLENLQLALVAAVNQYHLIRAERELLETTLTGSLKALADLLSLVNPEVFGRASRIKRYVQGLVGQLNLSDAWRMDIAAALSQIGCMMLPPSVVDKINQGQPLTPAEACMYKTVPATGASLLANIPRMEEVSEIIAYQQKHYDGSGSPVDSRRGDQIPIGARLLKVAQDFDTLRLQNYSSLQALSELQGRKGWYDSQVLGALKATFVHEPHETIVSVSLSELRPNVIAAESIMDVQGHLLVAKGQELTEWVVTRLKELKDKRAVRQPISVILSECQEENAHPLVQTSPVEDSHGN
jgi:response regulator RpfG family c-di-GMP phosphodiesterase